MARTLPNMALKAFFALGEDNWNNDVDSNFLNLSVAAQAVVEALVSAKPASPTEGSVYLLSASESTNPNCFAMFDGGAWKYLTPKKGWQAFDRSANSYRWFDGSNWIVLPSADPRIASLASLDAQAGVVIQTAATTFSKAPLGDATEGSILTRAHADARYAGVNHTHPNSVQSFNTRVGAVVLNQADIQSALTYVPQPLSPYLIAFAAMNGNAGIVEHTGSNTFEKRAIGVSNSTDLLSRSFGDARYAPLTAASGGLAALTPTNGILEQQGTYSFAKRKIDDPLDATSLLSVSQLDLSYVRQDSLKFIDASDTPSAYLAGYTLRVNDTADGLDFAPAQYINFKETAGTTYTVSEADAGYHIRMSNAASITVSLPPLTCQIGTVIEFEQGNTGALTITDATGAIITARDDRFTSAGRYAVVRATKSSATEWLISGDTVAASSGSAPLGSMLQLTAISPLALSTPTSDRIAKINDATGDRYLATLNGKWVTLLGDGTAIVPGFYLGRPQLPVGGSVIRSSSALVMSASGLYQAVASGQPRFGYVPVAKTFLGLLIEPARTNQITYSNDYSQTAWTKTGAVIASSAETTPNGNTASALKDNSDGTSSTVQLSINTLVMPSAGANAFSIFLHSGTRSRARLRLGGFTNATGQTSVDVDLTSGTITGGAGTIEAVGSGWYRVSLLASLDSANLTGQFIVQMLSDAGATSLTRNGSNTLLLWGAQAEAGAYVSTPIITTGAATTRPSDAFAMDWGSQLVGDGSVSVRYVFDDASTQTVTSTISGGFLTAPTNLTRRHVVRVDKA